MKVLMICTGNICRSPMAHGLLQHKVEQLGLDWKIDSAGIDDYHEGELPDRRAIDCMKHHGIDITYQRARSINRDDIKKFDVVYVMDRSHYNYVMEMAGREEERQKVKFIMDEVYPDRKTDVPDPYYGGDAGFEHVYKMLDKATDKIIDRLS